MSKTGRPNIDNNRLLVVRGPKKGPKGVARMVDLGEGRDHGKGEGGWGNPTPGRERGIESRGCR